MDSVFRALADPTRRAIIESLSDGDASVSDLAEPLPISLAAVVQHVQALEQCGLIHTEKAGRVRTCRWTNGLRSGAACGSANARFSRAKAAPFARVSDTAEGLACCKRRRRLQPIN